MILGLEQITSFMLTLGLVHDHVSQITKSAECNGNYTEELLNALFPNNVYLPATPEYAESISTYFGSRARLNASVIFVPDVAEQVSTGVKIMEFFDQQFAVRGGGQTSHPGMAGIEDDILFSLERMNELTLTPSKDRASIGPGNLWGRVFETLESSGVAVTGGTLAPVGVPGLLTGNGFSNFLSSRGFSTGDVVNFQVVLGGGRIVNANPAENPDLWWALKGGSNNFGIVTRFDMNTFPLPGGIWSGTLAYNSSQVETVAEAFYEIQTGALVESPHLDVQFMQMVIPGIGLTTTELVPFTDHVNFTGPYPSSLKPLFDIGPSDVSSARKTLTKSSTEAVTPEFIEVTNKRINRANINIKAHKRLYKEISTMLSAHYGSSTLEDHSVSLSWNPVTAHAVRESNRKGGNAGGWQEVNQVSLNLRVNWANAADDMAALKMDEEFMAKLDVAARKWDSLMPNQWANNAAANVDVMGSYGETNLEKLRAVSRKYDEAQIFQTLCRGGYKLWN
ncbi:unnamed protein product [Clonostachys rosea]|uniref:FAD-binding PCMH-type domain-containing protein n=1 Tax=Bionectria ochroleuca TaxID=29856 RepID=A0ABY6U4J1_BIOOC|nr:unnamed protein product [Clonostachys rosea]